LGAVFAYDILLRMRQVHSDGVIYGHRMGHADLQPDASRGDYTAQANKGMRKSVADPLECPTCGQTGSADGSLDPIKRSGFRFDGDIWDR
jgi:hypothetical protein